MYSPLLVYVMTWLMADSIWRLGNLGNTEFFKIIVDENFWTCIEFNFPMFLGIIYENPVTVLENSKWRIQYGGPNIEDLIYANKKDIFVFYVKYVIKNVSRHFLIEIVNSAEKIREVLNLYFTICIFSNAWCMWLNEVIRLLLSLVFIT